MESDSTSFLGRLAGYFKSDIPSTPHTTVRKGRAGEDIASAYLKKKGFSILERNFKWYGNEIDIIATDKKVLVFIEVKSSSSADFDHPLAWISPRKQERIIRASTGYMVSNNKMKAPVRFDVIAIRNNGEIDHIKDAFRT
jgi:putative endonuclease